MMDKLLLSYQIAWRQDRSRVKMFLKSRRIGISWSDAGDSSLIASLSKSDGGMSTYYQSYNKDMCRQYVKDAGDWADAYNLAASEMEELVFEESGQPISIFRIVFASGFEVLGMPAQPHHLRSKGGRVRLDEAAFCEGLAEWLKAARACIMWHPKANIGLISSHNGVESDFNGLVEDVRSGRKNYSLHVVTLDDALEQGLYKRICQKAKTPWSPEAEAQWRAECFADYVDIEDANEELLCIPKRSSGAYLTRSLIESCMSRDIPVLRWTPPAPDFVDWAEDKREQSIKDWCDDHIGPLLAEMSPALKNFVGGDFGRSGDLSIDWPLTEQEDLTLHTPFVLELRNMPFTSQQQVFFYLCDGLPRFSGAALDSRGNGQYLGEVARQRYGPELIVEAMLSEKLYREITPKMKAAFEDREWLIPQDAMIRDDFRAFRVVNGVAKIPDVRTKDAAGNKRHGDAGVAGMLAVWAAKTIDASEPFDVTSVSWSGPQSANNILKGWN